MILHKSADGDEALVLGSEYKLGNHKATYRAAFFPGSKFVQISILLGIPLFWLIFIIILIPFLENKVILMGVTILLAIGVLLLECRLIFYRNRKLRVFVYEFGLIHQDIRSFRTMIYWQNVQSFWYTTESTLTDGEGGHSSTRSIYHVSCTDGISLRLDDTFAKLDHLAKSIAEEIARPLYSAVLNTYQIGQSVPLGPVTVTHEGLFSGSKRFLWSEVQSIHVSEGYMVIRKQGQRSYWISAMIELPQAKMLWMLVMHVKSESARQLFPTIINTYQRDHAVVFGSLTVTPEGLFHRSAMLPWSKMGSIPTNETYDRHLVIRKQGKLFAWASLDLADAPSVEVFWMLVHTIRGGSLKE